MKRNTLLLLVLVVLLGAAFFVQQGKNRRLSTATASVKTRTYLLPDLPVNDIKKIRVRESGKQVSLAFTDGKWSVAERSGYPAAFDKISRTLMGLREAKIASAQPIAKDDLGTVKLLGPDEGPADSTGLQVDFMNDKGELLTSLVAGKTVETTGGASSGSFSGPGDPRFVRIVKEDGTAWQITEGLGEFTTAPADWVDKGFIDIRKIHTVQVTAPNTPDSWGAERKDENSEFTLMEPKNGDELDTAKAGSLAYLLSNPTFTDVLPREQATPDFMNGAVTAKITTLEGFTYDVKLLEKKGDSPNAEAKDYLAIAVSADIPKERTPEKDEKEEDKKKKDEEFAANKKQLETKLAKEKAAEGWIFEVSSYTVSTLLKKRSELLRDKTKTPATPEGAPPLPDSTPPTPEPAPAPVPEPAPKPEKQPAMEDKKPEKPAATKESPKAPPTKPAPAKPASEKKTKPAN